MSDAVLITNGYEPIAVEGKKALGVGWSTRPNTLQAIEAERDALPTATNTGLRTGVLVGVDIDLRDPEHAARTRELAFKQLGPTRLERVGSKGMMLCYRNASPVAKITVAAKGAKVELLGAGQHFVAFGLHPDTGAPYRWVRNDDLGPLDPLGVPFADLPEVTPATLREFSRRAGELLTELGYGAATVSGDLGEQPSAPSSSKGDPVSADHLRLLLSFIDPDASREPWRNTVAAIRACNVPDDEDESERRKIAHAFSEGRLDRFGRYSNAAPSLYTGPEDVDQVFDTMPPRENGVGYGSIFAAAVAGGYAGPPARPSTAEAFAGALKADESAAETQPEPEKAPASADRRLLHLDSRAPLVSAAHFIGRRYLNADGSKNLYHFQDAFYAYRGSHYAERDDRQLKAELYAFLDAAFDDGEPFRPTISKVNEVLAALKATTYLPTANKVPCWLDDPKARPLDSEYVGWDGKPWNAAEIISCKNGLLHFPSRTLMKHTPRLFAVNALDFAYDPEAPEPSEWLKFLGSIWPDDPEAIAALQEVFGYFLSGDLRQQKIPLLVGPKRAGKGTIARVLKALLGHDNVAAPTLSGLGQNFGLEPLIGKRAAIISDARLGPQSNQQVIVERLLSISGEDAQTIDRKFKSAWTGTLGVRFLILTNELPRLNDASGAIASRFVVLSLRNSFFGREDQSLTDRLLCELTGILNWSLAGLHRLNARGHFVVPKSSAEAVQELEELTSPIAAFLRQHCNVGGDNSAEVGEVYSRWVSWCHASNRQPGTPQTFGRDLRAAVPDLDIVQPRREGGRVRCYRGLGLISLDTGTLARTGTRV